MVGGVEEHAGEQHRSTFVVGDVHGHRAEMVAALQAAELVDDNEAWSGGTAQVWFLGDFFDRGPEGVAALDTAMRLAGEAEQAGGSVNALIGNHEVLALGMHRFGGTEIASDAGPRSFEHSWRLNGGLEADQEALTEAHVEWLCDRPALAVVADHLLMHSDTVEYLGWGKTVEEINSAVRELLHSENSQDWWECWRRLTSRYAFRGSAGPMVADEIMRLLGGSRIVHGHSVIAEQVGVLPSQIEHPHSYADDKVLGVDGGVFVGGPCLVVSLPWHGPQADGGETADDAEDVEDAAGETEAATEAEAEAEEDAEAGDTEGEDTEGEGSGAEGAEPDDTESEDAEPDDAEPGDSQSEDAQSEDADSEDAGSEDAETEDAGSEAH
jgi:hypothetical protein